MAKQRIALVERIMKLPYIKATRDIERGEERFVCRDDVITAIHEYAVSVRAQTLGRRGGLANKGIPKPKSAENGKNGGRPKKTRGSSGEKG